MFRRFLAVAVLALAAQPATANDLGWHIGRHFQQHGGLPACTASSVLGHIKSRFGSTQRNTWNTNLSIEDIDLIEETGGQLGGPGLIDRVYCRGRANLSDGRQEPVFYLIESRMGFAGHGSQVSFCLPAFDAYRVYDAWCRTAQPQAESQ